MKINMPIRSFAREVIGICGITFVVIGCRGAGSQFSPPGLEQQSMLRSSSSTEISHATFPGQNGRIAFVYGLPNDGGGDVYTMNSDGTHVRRLTHYGPSFKDAAEYVGWSPDARQIVFWRLGTKSGVGRLWIMDSDGRNKRRIFDDPGFSDIFPSFSPDGKQIVFARQELSGDFVIAIYRVGVDGTGLTPITRFNLEYNDLRPEYSPDGKQIEIRSGGPRRLPTAHRSL